MRGTQQIELWHTREIKFSMQPKRRVRTEYGDEDGRHRPIPSKYMFGEFEDRPVPLLNYTPSVPAKMTHFLVGMEF